MSGAPSQKDTWSVEIGLQYADSFLVVRDSADGLFLDLAYSLTGEVQLLTDLLQCVWLVAPQSEIQADHIGFTNTQSIERQLYFHAQAFSHHQLLGIGEVGVLHHIEHGTAVGTITQGRVHAQVFAAGAHTGLHLLQCHLQQFGKFQCGGGAFIFLFQLGERLVDAVDRTGLVQRKAHDARLFGQALQDLLTDPPHGIADELEAAGLIEAFGRLDEAEVAFADEVGQGEALALVLLGHGHNEAQIGLAQFLQSVVVPLLDAYRELHLLLCGDQLHFSDLGQVFVE